MLDALKILSNGILEKAKTFKGDWNENDSNSTHYIKNRTHWIEPEIQILVDEDFTIDEVYDNTFDININVQHSIKAGQVYQIIFNETEYTCEARERFGNILLGNGSIVEIDNYDLDIPFCILYYEWEDVSVKAGYNDPDSYECFLVTNEAGTFDLKISTMVEKVHKIDEKYLPVLGIGENGTGYCSSILGDCKNNVAEGSYSLAGGYYVKAYGEYSMGLGCDIEISDENSIAIGFSTNIYSDKVFSFGGNNTINKGWSVAIGFDHVIDHFGSIAMGTYLQTSKENQIVFGRYNADDEDAYLIVGNGSWQGNRRNIFTISEQGDGWFSGDIYSGDNKVATEKYVSDPKDYTVYNDPITEQRYAVQVRDGRINTAMVASKLEIITQPNKMIYAENDRIDIEGIVVKTIADDGTEMIVDNKLLKIEPERAIREYIKLSYYDFGQEIITYLYIETRPFDPAIDLVDFNYIVDDSSTPTRYMLTDWKGTYNGESSTRLIIPDNPLVYI